MGIIRAAIIELIVKALGGTGGKVLRSVLMFLRS
jgi:hypothetical protein